jgi:GNAT superfamily N-acetyltransferase
MNYDIIEGSAEWADRYREFYRQAVQIYYLRPEAGITADLFSPEVMASPRIRRYFEDLCENTADKKAWLAVSDQNEILGVIGAKRYADHCELKAFYVRPDLKGHGIGHALYTRALDFVGGQTIIVDVVDYMTETIETYKHWGFEVDESKGKDTSYFPEWPEEIRRNFLGIYMVKPAKN